MGCWTMGNYCDGVSIDGGRYARVAGRWRKGLLVLGGWRRHERQWIGHKQDRRWRGEGGSAVQELSVGIEMLDVGGFRWDWAGGRQG